MLSSIMAALNSRYENISLEFNKAYDIKEIKVTIKKVYPIPLNIDLVGEGINSITPWGPRPQGEVVPIFPIRGGYQQNNNNYYDLEKEGCRNGSGYCGLGTSYEIVATKVIPSIAADRYLSPEEYQLDEVSSDSSRETDSD